MSLRDLDDRLLPRLATRLASLRVKRPRLPAGLRALDERYAGSGPLALVRDVPQLGLVVVGAVFLAGAGVAVSRESARMQERAVRSEVGASPAPVAEGGPVALGPVAGVRVADYVTSAKLGLGVAAGSPLALVSLSRYLTPAQAVSLLAGTTVRRVYLRAPAAGPDAAQFPVEVTDLRRDLARTYAQTALGREQARSEYQKYVDTISPQTEDEKQFRALYASLAKAARIEAKAYGSGCACVFAAVVEAPVARLRGLAAADPVRAVQVARPGVTVRQVDVVPLLPETTGLVPKRQMVGG